MRVSAVHVSVFSLDCPLHRSIKVPSLKAAEILDDRLGLALGQPGGPVPDLPHGHPLLVDPTGPTSNVPVEIPHKR